MYYYIIDPQKIEQGKYDRVQNDLYSCVAQLKISGEMSRVTPLRTVSQLVDTALLRGATTIVAVGHDSTVQEVINALGDREVAVGYVPLLESELGRILGLDGVPAACQALAHRRTEVLDLGRIHSHFFLTRVGIGQPLEQVSPQGLFDFSRFGQVARLSPVPIRLEVDGLFRAEFNVALGAVFNSRAAKTEERVADPSDGVLDVLLLPAISSFDAWKYRNELATGCLERIPGCAVIHGRRITVSGPDDLPFYVGQRAVAKGQAVIEVVPAKVRMVIGRDRMF